MKRSLLVLAALLAFPGSAAGASMFRVAGGGEGGPNDGGPAREARLSSPRGIALTPDGGFVFADANAARVRRVRPDGIITTVAGTGVECPSGTDPCGDGGPSGNALLVTPTRVAVTSSGGLLISDSGAHEIRYVSSYEGGTISTVAGAGTQGFSGDGGSAIAAQLAAPSGIQLLPDGSFLVADALNHRIRRVSGVSGGTITTVAGTGGTGFDSGTFAGDGGPATEARFSIPTDVAAVPSGGFLVADRANHRIRRITGIGGTVSTVAGGGAAEPGFTGDGGAALRARINEPEGVAAAPDGGFVIAESEGHRIRRVTPAGRIFTLAGTGVRGERPPFPPDGASGPEVALGGFPKAVAVTPDGATFFADGAGLAIYTLDTEFAAGSGGPPGPTGPQGLPGAQGSPGPAGPAGPAGSSQGGGASLFAAFGANAYKVRAKRKLKLTVVSVAAGRLSVGAFAKGKRSAGTDKEVEQGRNSLSFTAPKKKGAYELRLTLTVGGRDATDRAKLRVAAAPKRRRAG